MPTYRNDSTGTLPITYPSGGHGVIKPGETAESYEVRTDLVETLATPYYNPFVAIDAVTFLVAGNQTVAISNVRTVTNVIIRKVVTCNIAVYLGALANVPAFEIAEDGALALDLDRTVDQLILVADAAGSCEVVQTSEDVAIVGEV